MIDRPLRDRLAGDDVVLGARATTIHPAVIETYGTIGLDYAWLDLEHTGASAGDAPALEALVRAAEAAGIDLLVRLPDADPDLVRKTLDTGVRSLLLPRVESAEAVRAAIRASRFRYDGAPGGRGAAAGRAADWGATPEEYVAAEDDSVCVGVMLETAAALESLEELLSVPDLGFAFVGPSDLSISLGHPLETDHPDVAEAVGRIETACRSADVPLAGIATDAAIAADRIDAGYDLLRIGDELAATRQVLGNRVGSIRDGSG